MTVHSSECFMSQTAWRISIKFGIGSVLRKFWENLFLSSTDVCFIGYAVQH